MRRTKQGCFFRQLLQLAALAVFLMAAAPFAKSDVRYIYDAAGRVVQVIAPDGNSARYRYDAAGNITGIERYNSTDLVLSAFSPSSAGAGTQVKIYGGGFSSTASANTVTFNGAAAFVVSASASELVVLVPSSASTGLIRVAVAGNSVTAMDPFTVTQAPVITDFTPKLVSAGANVTVTGNLLEPIPGSTQVSIGGSLGQAVSYSNSALTFSVFTTARSGRITVTTPVGSAATEEDLIVMPTAVPAANVASSAQLNVGSAATLDIVASKYAVVAVRADADQYLSAQINSLTPSNVSVSYQIYSPANTPLSSGSISNTSKTIEFPRTPSKGTYLIVFSAGTTTVNLNVMVEANPIFTGVEPSFSAATSATYQRKRFIMRAAAGDDMGVGVSQLVTAPANTSVTFSVTTPSGGSVGETSSCVQSVASGNCNWWALDLPSAGDYVISVAPQNSTVTFNITASKALQGTVTEAAQSVSIERPGQFALYTFATDTNDTVALRLTSVVTTPSSQQVLLRTYGSVASYVKSSVAAGDRTLDLYNIDAGTHRVLILPYYGARMTAQLKMITSTSTSVDGIARNFTATTPATYFKFDATAGQSIGIGLGNITAPATIALYGPNGQSPSGVQIGTCVTGNPDATCNAWLLSVAQTGLHTLVVTPSSGTQMNFNLAISPAVTGMLSPGVPQAANISSIGQFAVFTFNIAAGQNVTVSLTSVATTPASKTVSLLIYNANGLVRNSSGIANQTLSLTNLAAGTYRVVILPWYGLRATAQVSYQ